MKKTIQRKHFTIKIKQDEEGYSVMLFKRGEKLPEIGTRFSPVYTVTEMVQWANEHIANYKIL